MADVMSLDGGKTWVPLDLVMLNSVPFGERRVATDCSDMPSLTRQSEKDACDINKIMARFEKTGLLPEGRNGEPVFADVSQMGDYRTALDTVERAETLFMSLPAKVRAEFDNNPAQFLDEWHTPGSAKKFQSLGLLPADPLPPPGAPPVVPPAA